MTKDDQQSALGGLGAEVDYPFTKVGFKPGDSCAIDCFMYGDAVVERLVFPRSLHGRLKVLGNVTLGIQILASDVEYERLSSLEGPGVIPRVVARCGQSIRVVLENISDEEIVVEGAFARVRQIPGRWIMDSALISLQDRGRALLASADTEVFARGWLAAIDELVLTAPTDMASWASWADFSVRSKR